MDRIRVDGANGIRFSTRKIFSSGNGLPFNGAFTNTTSASETIARIPKTDINPNKAVFTIDSKTSNILIVNNKACQLLDYRPSELCDMKFSSLLTNKTNKNYVSALAEGQLNSEDGTMVLLSGKVVEMISKCGTKVAVSLWIRQIDADGRCLAVAEPVERRIAQIIIDKFGQIMSIDSESLLLFQIDTEDELYGSDVRHLIPAIQLPTADSWSNNKQTMYKQKATGKTKDNLSFPLCLMIAPQSDTDSDNGDDGGGGDGGVSDGVDAINLYVITIWVFQNISGLVVIDENGSIELCNHHFSMLMFGYAQSKITQLHITDLIPNFAQELEYLGIGEWNYNSRSRNITYSSLDNESETETDPVYYEAESFYATPVGTTASDRSKSINENEPSIYEMSSTMQFVNHQNKTADMSKAISEPIQIYLDTLISTDKMEKINEKLTDAKCESPTSSQHHQQQQQQSQLQQQQQSSKPNMEQRSGSLGKSFSDNTLSAGSMCSNVTNIGKRQPKNPFKPASIQMNDIDHGKSPDQEDETTSNCDASELLTPVNETNLSVKYLLSSDTSDSNFGGQMDLSDGLNDLEIDVPTVENNEKDKTTTTTTTTTTTVQRNGSAGQTPKTSTQRFSTQQNTFPDGKYNGKAIHCDGNIFNILYTISSQELPCGRKVFCVWICRDECDLDDEEEDDDGKHPNLTLTFNSITSNIETSVDGGVAGTTKRNSMNVNGNQSSRPNSVSLLSQYEDEQISGEYNKYYTSLKQIGKGAFGYVKLSFRHTDRLLVVTKFILKDKLPPQFMVIADDKKEIPMEVYLLSTLKHPNIVTVLDVFENEKYFQLVMEKHGSGMDLFEFIDRRPLMDEQLGSFIFRQIVNAIDYLHSLKILHRDIKDENIIIDQYFHVKLIDFGSATFMEDGKLFSTFYGTTEYCSPEVLSGNKYAGPELEIWALGITLFVLIFFENPFIDIEETLHSELHLPHTVSSPLEKILTSMLDKNPKTRYTMKQLISDAWITQELSSCNFNFSWVVPCENFESNPDKYFTGQIYSSATGLSTTSPTSLADEDSIIDDDDIEDEELCEEACSMQFNQEFDYRKCRKSNDTFETKDTDQSLDASMGEMANTTTIINATTNTGKAIQLPIATVKNHVTKRNSMILSNLNNHPLDSQKPPNKCNCIIATTKPINNTMTKNAQCDDKHQLCSTQHKESFSCDSISKAFISTQDQSEPIKRHQSPNLIATSTTTTICNPSANQISSTPTPPSISLSKSETNISESNAENDRNQLAIYNVASLNDLHENDTFFNRTMNDHSKNQCLTNCSEYDLCDLGTKKHIVTLTGPKVMTTVTVSMRNAADVSDKIF